MHWLWFLVGAVFVYVLWRRREGFEGQDPYSLCQAQQGEIEYIHTQFKKNVTLNREMVDEVKKYDAVNQENTMKMQQNIAFKDANKRKDAYPDMF
jgi:hypothetical protein